MSPSARSLALLRDLGYLPATVERRLPYSNTTVDLFGFIDLVAMRPDEPGLLGVQTTTRPNQSARFKKAIAAPALRIWLACGQRLEIHGWAKCGRHGERKTWQCTRRPVTLADLEKA